MSEHLYVVQLPHTTLCSKCGGILAPDYIKPGPPPSCVLMRCVSHYCALSGVVLSMPLTRVYVERA